MKLYIYSTLSNDQLYATQSGDVFIAGKVNITNKHFLTPRGVVTEVTPEQYAQLKKNHVFKLHMQNGYILVDQHKVDPEKAATDMNSRDESAPDTPESLAAEGKDIPKTGKEDKETK
ncbi:MAG: hypothetical protein LBN41_04275 [Enterobacteriaceae bacterium]|jgi:hypothetical protein|nr:hypothetical protein [Enterobacteriaceae bacterium]